MIFIWSEILFQSCFYKACQVLALIFVLFNRMQSFYKTPWPKDTPRQEKTGLIEWVKQKENYSYHFSTSRSDYFRSITNSVTVFQRKLFRERTSIIEENKPHFPVWMNFPNVPPPLPPGEEDF